MLGDDLDRFRMHDEDDADVTIKHMHATQLSKIVDVIAFQIELVIFGEHIFDAPILMHLENGYTLRNHIVAPICLSERTVHGGKQKSVHQVFIGSRKHVYPLNEPPHRTALVRDMRIEPYATSRVSIVPRLTFTCFTTAWMGSSHVGSPKIAMSFLSEPKMPLDTH